MMAFFHGGDLSGIEWFGTFLIFLVLPVATIGIFLKVFFGDKNKR